MAASSNNPPESSLTITPPPATAVNSDNSSIGVSVNSPTQSRRAGAKAAGFSPWTPVVRGESEVASFPLSPKMAQPHQSAGLIEQKAATEEESAEYGSGNAGKRPAWNKPSNGAGVAAAAAAAAAEVGPVIDAHSWPALSETTTRGGSSTKLSSDSLKALADAAVSLGTGMANLDLQKQVSNNGNPNSTPSSTPNHTATARQKITRRNAAGTSSNGGIPQPPAPHGPAVEMPLNHFPHSQKSVFVSQSHSSNDHPQQRNSYRNRNSGTHPRGDGSHHHNYGGKRDQDRGNQDWHAHRNFNGRDAPMQPQRDVSRYMRHPPPPPLPGSNFIAPGGGQLRPFVSHFGFPEYGAPMYYVAPPPPHLDAFRGGPFFGQSLSPHVYFPAPDPQLHTKIVHQIDYYFSTPNLIKDTYLRQNMDGQGWVPIKLIAGFKKVSHLTDNIPLILDALRSSTVVEVQGDKIRRRDDWMRWLMPQIHQVDAQAGAVSRSSSTGDFNNQLQRTSSVGTGQVSLQGGSDVSGKLTN